MPFTNGFTTDACKKAGKPVILTSCARVSVINNYKWYRKFCPCFFTGDEGIIGAISNRDIGFASVPVLSIHFLFHEIEILNAHYSRSRFYPMKINCALLNLSFDIAYRLRNWWIFRLSVIRQALNASNNWKEGALNPLLRFRILKFFSNKKKD
jgi:hypothetical protein